MKKIILIIVVFLSILLFFIIKVPIKVDKELENTHNIIITKFKEETNLDVINIHDYYGSNFYYIIETKHLFHAIDEEKNIVSEILKEKLCNLEFTLGFDKAFIYEEKLKVSGNLVYKYYNGATCELFNIIEVGK